MDLLIIVLGPTIALVYALITLASAAQASDIGFNFPHGTSVLAVSPGSAAALAGLQQGDRIIEVNGAKTLDPISRYRAVHSIPPGGFLDLVVDRAGSPIKIDRLVATRNLPLGSILTTLLGLALLLIAIYAGRGRWSNHPRTFLRSTIVYVVFFSGLHSLDVVLGSMFLGPIWIASMVLAAPLTCHFMMKFPAGPVSIGKIGLIFLYLPTALISVPLISYQLFFTQGVLLPGHIFITEWGLSCVGLLAAIYLCTGAYLRASRVRSTHQAINPATASWLKLNSICVALPFLVGMVWIIVDQTSFLGDGFKLLATITVFTGSFCLLMAMAQTPCGQLDQYWQRSSGYIVAVFTEAGILLALVGIGGIGDGQGDSSHFSSAEVRSALWATLAAAIIFGPLRTQVQSMIDKRFGCARIRTQRLLRQAFEAAVATLDVSLLQSRLVHQIRTAIGARGVAIYTDIERSGNSADHNPSHVGWSREAWAGHSPLARVVDGDTAKALDRAISANVPVELNDGILAIPLPIGDGNNVIIVVAPKEGSPFDTEQQHLLRAAAAGWVIAIGNARTHTALQGLTEKLKRQVEISEKRRREIARLKDRVDEENRALIGKLALGGGGIGGKWGDRRAPAVIGQGLRPTFALVQKVARTNSSVLVRGETGAGKELIARAIHAASPRREGPFIVVDCGAIAPALIESTLFGHLRGAFTGAVRDSSGAFRAAQGGTVFLDEIGDLPIELQPKLLRVLQEREVYPVGSSTPVAMDVRVVSGTHRDLVAKAQAGDFRSDLLYRLQVVEIKIPPLRDRRGDIAALAKHFLAHTAASAGQPVKRLTDGAMAALLDHDWPGNVRELEHTLEAAAIYSEEEEIRATDLPLAEKIFRRKGRIQLAAKSTLSCGGAPREGLRETLKDLEKNRLLEVLAEQNGNKSATARRLGMSRGALLRRLKSYAICA